MLKSHDIIPWYLGSLVPRINCDVFSFQLLCECSLLKNNVVSHFIFPFFPSDLSDSFLQMDDATSQFDMTKLEKVHIEESSLNADQKVAASTAIKSCILGNLKSPTLPIIIERMNPGAFIWRKIIISI